MKWNSHIKEIIGYVFAGFAFIVGFGITIAGFCVEPVGEIHSTVLVVLGQCLVYSGMILGYNLSIKNGFASVKGELRKTIDRRFNELEDESRDSLDDKKKEAE